MALSLSQTHDEEPRGKSIYVQLSYPKMLVERTFDGHPPIKLLKNKGGSDPLDSPVNPSFPLHYILLAYKWDALEKAGHPSEGE
jgi:hypothetical protein